MTNREIVEDIKAREGTCDNYGYACDDCPLYALSKGCENDQESLKYANKWLNENHVRESWFEAVPLMKGQSYTNVVIDEPLPIPDIYKNCEIASKFIGGVQSTIPHEIKAVGKNMFDSLKLMHRIFNNKGEIMRFKAGDRVVINCKYGAIEAGEKATFVKYDGDVGTGSNKGMPFVNIKTDKGRVLNMYEFRIDLITEEDDVFKKGDRVVYTNDGDSGGYNGSKGDTGVVEKVEKSTVWVKRDDTGYVEVKNPPNIKLIPSYTTTKIEDFPDWLKAIPRDEVISCWVSDVNNILDEESCECVEDIHSFTEGYFTDTDGEEWLFASPVTTPVTTPVISPEKAIAEKALIDAQAMVVVAQEAIKALK